MFLLVAILQAVFEPTSFTCVLDHNGGAPNLTKMQGKQNQQKLDVESSSVVWHTNSRETVPFWGFNLDLEDWNPTFSRDTLGHDDAPSLQVWLHAYSLALRKISSGQRCAARKVDNQILIYPPPPPHFLTGGYITTPLWKCTTGEESTVCIRCLASSFGHPNQHGVTRQNSFFLFGA